MDDCLISSTDREGVTLQGKIEIKKTKPLQIFNDTGKNILLYLAYTSPPVTIDNIISFSGLSSVAALNIMEDLKKHRFVSEKKTTGKGVYYSGEINIQDYMLKNTPKEDLRQVISFITKFQTDEEKKNIALAELYLQTSIDGDGIEYIKKAADILDRSGNREKAVFYYDFIIEHFLENGIPATQPAPYTEDFLDSVFQRVSRVLFFPMPLNKLLSLLEKAYEIAKRYNNPVYLAKIKFLLGRTLLNYGQTDRALRYINESWKLIEKIPDKAFLKEHLFLTGITITKTLTGRFSEAIDYYEKMIGNLEQFGEEEEDLMSSLLVALSLISCGRISRGMGMMDVIKKKAQSLNLERVVSHSIFTDIIALIGIRKIPEAETCLSKLLEFGGELLDNNTKGSLHFCRAFILCTKEDYKGAYEQIKKGFEYRESMDMGLHPYCPWILECLYLLELRGFSDEVVNFDLELNSAINGENIFLKGAAFRYRALRNMEKQQSRETILPDLKLSEKLLKQSGAEIELARTRTIMRDYYLAQGKQELARSSGQKIWAFFFNINENLIPNDLLKNMSWARKTELIVEKITSINTSINAIKNQSALIEIVMNVAMDFTNATQSGVYINEEDKLKLIASRNIDSISLNQEALKLAKETIANAIKKNKEIIIPEGDNVIYELFGRLGIRSFIGIPLKLNESSYGYFFISNHFGGGPFPVQTLSFMRMFASQIEIGLSNLNAYENIKKLKERFEDEAIFYKKELGLDMPVEHIIGESEEIKKVIEQVRQVSSTNSLVLILGETGVGKELVAKAIHNLSKRKDGPFISVNLSTFPHDLVANELFGHEKGAFSGAHDRKKGRFELANGGTMFLDEIGDLTLEVQVKLLRILQEGTFERLGSSTSIRSDFRIIVATNKNLRQEVENGNFRQDLYYRLNVFPIYVPPLRERKKDIPLLVQHFSSIFNKKLGKNIKRIPAEEIKKLMTYHWPGNIRELEHFIERAVILSNGHQIKFSNLEFEINDQLIKGRPVTLLADIEREHIETTLKNTFWKISGPLGAASLLGMPPSTLRHRMKKLGIEKHSKAF
jgi:transcriptional regulator with GAF, ATPase, and Fis domain